MTTQRAAKKQAKADPVSPKLLRAMKKALKTPLDQWITGTHADVRAQSKKTRKKARG